MSLPRPTNRPGEWLCCFPLNEHQELMTLEDFALLCPPENGVGEGGDRGQQQSPTSAVTAIEIAEDPMAQLVHVHYRAAGFDFWVSAVDPYSGELSGFARILGSGSEGQFCLINYWDMSRWRIPERVLLGELMMISIERDTGFTTRTLREALAEQVSASCPSSQPVVEGGAR